jgi:hypothetical protein
VQSDMGAEIGCLGPLTEIVGFKTMKHTLTAEFDLYISIL